MSLTKPLQHTLRTTQIHLDRLQMLGLRTVQDLLLYFPRAYIDKSAYTKIADLRTDEINNIKATITSIFHKRTKYGKSFTKAILSDDTGSVESVWFNQSYLQKILKKGREMIFSGKAKFAGGKISLTSPAFEEEKIEQIHVGRIVPIYHETAGISSKWLREKIRPLAREWSRYFEEYLPSEIVTAHQLMPYSRAILEIHFPENAETLEKAKKTLSFHELFLLQLKAIQKKWRWQNVAIHEQKQISIHPSFQEFLKKIPFELTAAQKKSLKEILLDLKKPYPMSRLLQGDVGSGKTVVAAAAIFNTVKMGYQSALMAPTEILAKQHYQTIYKLLQSFDFNIQFISGSIPQSVKENIVMQLKTGTVDIVIGTHALISEKIGFKNLGLAVIDEQHRFGVKQREILKSYGSPHLLSLSATPIPRTLAMTIYGDQDISLIDEMPKGRQEIITRVVPEKKRMDAYLWIQDQVQKGRQAFIICPLIDVSDVLEVKSAIQEYEYLKKEIFPMFKVGLLHGKMKPKEKAEIMTQFTANDLQILVSTSVVEVGIDVQNATIMVIEGSERFGLSQLHQFRGRVGRGVNRSYCFLFTNRPQRSCGPSHQMPEGLSINTNDVSAKRLQSMVQFSSGFKLAEIDLQLRGPGEIYGVRQSGIPDLKMASLTDSITIQLARDAAQNMINKDPELKKYPKLAKKLTELQEVFVND